MRATGPRLVATAQRFSATAEAAAAGAGRKEVTPAEGRFLPTLAALSPIWKKVTRSFMA